MIHRDHKPPQVGNRYWLCWDKMTHPLGVQVSRCWLHRKRRLSWLTLHGVSATTLGSYNTYVAAWGLEPWFSWVSPAALEPYCFSFLTITLDPWKSFCLWKCTVYIKITSAIFSGLSLESSMFTATVGRAAEALPGTCRIIIMLCMYIMKQCFRFF